MSSTMEEAGAEVEEEDPLFMCKVCRGVVTESDKSSHAKSHKMQEGPKKKKAKSLQPATEVTLFEPVASSSSASEAGEDEDGTEKDIINGVFTPAFLDELLVASKPGCSLKRKTPPPPAKNTQKVGGTYPSSTTPNPASTQGRKSMRASTLGATSSSVVACSSDPKPASSSSRRKARVKDTPRVRATTTTGIPASNPISTQEGRRNGLGPGGRIGLIQVHNENHHPIPLLSVHVKARVLQVIAEVVVIQVYQNKERQPVEAIYYFPTNPEGAVTHFEAEVDGRIVTGKVKPNEEAQADFDAAVKNKKSAFLGEEIEPDVFKLRVGYLKPGSQAKVTIKYVTEVKNEPGSNNIRFYIPTTIAPRYVPLESGGGKAEEIAQMRFTPSSPVPLSIGVDIFLDGGIEDIESPSHKVTVSTGGLAENPSWSKGYVTLASDTTQMDRDFVLNIRPTDPHRPSLHIARRDDGWTAAMLHLLPSFQLEEQKSELIFVLDRSGSMEGQSMELATEALQLFLHSMPADCYFNIIGFGWTFQSLFSASAKYSDRTLQQAIKHAKGMKADLGGTELLQPLKKILNKPIVKGYLRQVFVLTDGQVENTERVIGVVQANSGKVRVFSLGIGEAASHHLVEGLAKAGGGTASFVALNESMDAKVLNLLKNALNPTIGAIQLAWEGMEPEETPPVLNTTRTLLGFNKPQESGPPRSTPLCLDNGNSQSPKQIPPLHDGSQMLVFGLFQSQIPTSVIITARAPGGPLTLRVDKSPANFIETSDLIHTLAAIKLVRGLELEDANENASLDTGSGSSTNDAIVSQERQTHRKQEIMEIAIRNGITSKYTSFVAVDNEGDDGLPSSESWVMMTTRHVPNELAHGWGGTGMGVEEVPIPLPPPSSPAAARKRKGGRRTMQTARKSTSNWWRPGDVGGGGGGPRPQLRKRPVTYYSHRVGCSEAESDEEDATEPIIPSPTAPRKKVGRRIQNTVRKYVGGVGGGGDFALVYAKWNYHRNKRKLRTKSYGESRSVVCGGPLLPSFKMQPNKTPVSSSEESGESDEGANNGEGDRVVLRLAKHQSFDGSFSSWSKTLARLIGTPVWSLEGLRLEIQKECDCWQCWLPGGSEHHSTFLGESASATALTILAFETKLASLKPSWELIVRKARTWLENNIPRDLTISDVLQAASDYLDKQPTNGTNTY